jgi:hypothetical protein
VPADPTVAALLTRALLAQGVRRVFRAPGCHLPHLPELDEVALPSAELATALADAAGRLAHAPSAGPGVAFLPGLRVRISSQPGAVVLADLVTEPSQMILGVAGWSIGRVHGCIELDLELDLDAPPPDGLEPLELSMANDQLLSLSPTLAEFRTVIVAGPGVGRAGQADGLVEAARHTGAPVVETVGAVGTLPFAHPARAGVVGLQERDAELSGLSAAELVITVGVDTSERGDLALGGAQVLEVEPWHLPMMALRWPEPVAGPAPAPLVEALAASPPPGPDGVAWAAATEVLAAVAGDTVLAADAGPAAWWLARGLAPCRGRVVVPALPAPGFAAAAAFVAALEGRPGLAVTTDVTDPVTEQALDLARGLELPLVVLRCRADASPTSAAAVHEVVSTALQGGTHDVTVGVDLTRTAALEAIAGPLVAWPPTSP